MRPPRLLYAALLTAVTAVLLSGCGDDGRLEIAGATPTAVGPVRLWPGLAPVTSPPNDYGETDTERVPGITVPAAGVRELDPVSVLLAEAAAKPSTFTGADDRYQETVARLHDCTTKPASCPVLPPYYRDLTGDGQDELIVGITLPRQQTAVRCYMPGQGGLTRIMATYDQLVNVELAGRDLVLRSVSAGIPGYEYRTVWSWDARQNAMLATSDEIVRVTPSPSATPPPSATPRRPAAGP
ncbi:MULTISPECIES: hypothetical protein [unclassified Streptomyces]|uniref:hypothetical protein n=1 Tax=unclassified Streptomyces TaxID=2593676 RepID=UPI0033349D7A